jgi:hypothetical protein
MLKQVEVDVGGEHGNQKEVAENEPQHEKAIDPVNGFCSEIDENSEEKEKGKWSDPRGDVPACDPMEEFEEERGAPRNVGRCEGVKKEEINDPAEDSANSSEGFSCHGDEIDFARKGEVDVEEEERGDEEKKPADSEERKRRKEAGKRGNDGEGEHSSADGCSRDEKNSSEKTVCMEHIKKTEKVRSR